MTHRTDPAQVVRFSVFELDLRSGELRKSGMRVTLQDQPLEILKTLLERPGDLITREELHQRLWHDETFVDFEDGLNAAMRRLRDALGDNATTPRFVETLPRRGYRFIAPLSGTTERPVSSGGPAQQPSRGVAAALAGASWRRVVPWLLAAVVIVTASVMNWAHLRGTPRQQPTIRFAIDTHRLAVLGAGPAVALSPDGMSLAYVVGDSDWGQLYLRRLNSLESTAVAGADQMKSPFFSPDGQWLAFFTRGTLQKVSLGGGSPSTVCTLPTIDAPLIRGGSWGDDGSIVFDSGTKLWRVSAAGGIPQRIATPDDVSAYFPDVLPGSQVIVFTGLRLTPSRQSGAWALSLRTGQLHLLAEGASIARYMRSGHLIFAAKGSLLAAPLDLQSQQLTAPPVSVVQDVRMESSLDPRSANYMSPMAHFAVSHSGTLVYIQGPDVPAVLRTLVWVNREGKEDPLPVSSREYSWPRLSPDGSRLAVGIFDDSDAPGNVGIYDLVRKGWTRLTSDPAEDGRPLWAPDGRHVVFRSKRDGTFHLYWQAADGTGVAERLTTEPNADRTAWSFSPDGKALVYSELSDQSYDLQVLLLEGRRTQTLGRTRFFKGSPAISRDGRWIAYRADETGRDEIYVRPFPDWDKERVQVSANGGRAPVWSADGRELFFDNGDAMMVVPVQTSGDFAHGTPRLLFEGQYVHGSGGARNFDVAPDGRRFIMVKEIEGKRESPGPDSMTVVFNWTDELRQRLTVGK